MCLESQNLSVQLTLYPTTAIGVLFALVHEDTVPLSVALADYHPGTDEWRDVSAAKISCQARRAIHRNKPPFQFVLVTAGGVILASSPAPLCDGESHEIQVKISGNRTQLLVDGEPGRSEDAEVNLLSPSSTYIGGLPGGEH